MSRVRDAWHLVDGAQEDRKFQLAVNRFRIAVAGWDDKQIRLAILAGWNEATDAQFADVYAALGVRPKWQT